LTVTALFRFDDPMLMLTARFMFFPFQNSGWREYTPVYMTCK
jgi:hypothetical protein